MNETTPKRFKPAFALWALAACLFSTATFVGCDDDDPVEEAVEEVADEIDDAT